MRFILVLLAAAALAVLPVSHEWLMVHSLALGLDALLFIGAAQLIAFAAGLAVVAACALASGAGNLLAARTGIEPHVWGTVALIAFMAFFILIGPALD